MREFQERRRTRKLLHSRYVIVLLVILIVLLVRGVIGAYEKYNKSRDLASRTEKDFAELSARQVLLSRSIDSLATDVGKERQLRDEFGVIREGEKMIVLINDKAEATTTSQPIEKGWWTRFIGFFGF